MITTVRFAFDEDMLRSVRAGVGRGGKATRKEVREFVEVAVHAAIRRLPPPKRRKPKASIVERRASLTVAPAETPDELRAVREKIARAFRR